VALGPRQNNFKSSLTCEHQASALGTMRQPRCEKTYILECNHLHVCIRKAMRLGEWPASLSRCGNDEGTTKIPMRCRRSVVTMFVCKSNPMSWGGPVGCMLPEWFHVVDVALKPMSVSIVSSSLQQSL
jgi:hypothetical protein